MPTLAELSLQVKRFFSKDAFEHAYLLRDFVIYKVIKDGHYSNRKLADLLGTNRETIGGVMRKIDALYGQKEEVK